MSDQELKRFAMGLATLEGQRPQGFFTPYRHAASVPLDVPEYAEIAAMMRAAEPAMRVVLDSVQQFGEALTALNGPPPVPRWTQDWFPRLDGAAAYALIRSGRPGTIIEVGSGHSTRFAARAIADGGLATRQICIDPAPRADLKGLPVEWISGLLSPDHLPLFDALGAGDIVFIDSSHVLWPGSDVDLVLARILPRLARGVIVHIHDITLPDANPPDWRWRGYTEQQGVAALLAGGGYDILFSSHYAITRMGAASLPVVSRLPLTEGARETSLWLRKGSAGVWR